MFVEISYLSLVGRVCGLMFLTGTTNLIPVESGPNYAPEPSLNLRK